MNMLKKILCLIILLFTASSIIAMEEDEGESTRSLVPVLTHQQQIKVVFRGDCERDINPGICLRIAMLSHLDRDGVVHLPISKNTFELVAALEKKVADYLGCSLYDKFNILWPFLKRRLQLQAQSAHLLEALEILGMPYLNPIIERVLAVRVASGQYYQRHPELPKKQRVLGGLRTYNPNFSEEFANRIAELIFERGIIRHNNPPCARPISYIDGLPLTFGFIRNQILSFKGFSRRRDIKLFLDRSMFNSPNSQEVLPNWRNIDEIKYYANGVCYL